jgi:hypothetical protein
LWACSAARDSESSVTEPVGGGIAFVQGTANSNQAAGATTCSASLPAPATAGDLIVVGANWFSQVATAVVSDSQGDAYQAAVAPTNWSGTSYRAQVFYAKNITGGATSVTVTLSGGSNSGCEMYVEEYSGIDPVSPLDQTAVATGPGGQTPSSGARTTTQPQELIFGYAESADAIAGAGAGFTTRSTYNGNLVEDEIVSATGSYAATFAGSDANWIAAMATFKAANTSTDGGAADSAGGDSGGADSGGADSGGADTGGPDSGGADSGGADSGGTDSGSPPPPPLAFVQGIANSNLAAGATMCSATLPGPATAGDLIVVGANWFSQAATAVVSDSQGDAYQAALAPTNWSGTSYRAQVFYAKNITGGATSVTVTLSGGSNSGCEMYVEEYAGVDRVSPLDQTAVATGPGGQTPSSGTRTTTQARELIFGYAESATSIAGAGAGFTVRSTYNDNLVEDEIVSTTGSYAATFAGSAANWLAAMATFKAAAGTPTDGGPPGDAAPDAPVDATLGDAADGSSGGAPLLHVSANGRTLLGSNNQPFYLVGDSAWCLVAGITVSQASSYFQTRASQGFNAALIDANVELGASPVGAPPCSPADVNGNLPFNGTLSGSSVLDVSTVPAPGDTTSTAGQYWANVDQIIAAASQNGIQVIFNVYDNYNSWFGHGSSPNSTAKLTAYGQFLGQRYVNFDNIIWMIGNDYSESSEGDADLAAVMQGIRQFDTRHIGWAFDEYGAAFDNTGLRSSLALNNIYEFSTGPWRSLYLSQYNRSDFGPIFNIESGYENNTAIGMTEADLREEHYSFLLSGATGDTYGNEFVWPFADSWQNWQAALTSQGGHEVTYLAQLVNSIPWSNLIPDQNGTVFQGVGSPTDYCGAYSSDGTLALAYQPATGQTSQSFLVTMSQFAGQVTARWFDPTAGTYVSIGSFANSGTRTFNSPSTNSAGQNDFVLVLQAP